MLFLFYFGPEKVGSGHAEIPIFIVITVNFSPSTGKKRANGIFYNPKSGTIYICGECQTKGSKKATHTVPFMLTSFNSLSVSQEPGTSESEEGNVVIFQNI